jgi:hypothetical protein
MGNAPRGLLDSVSMLPHSRVMIEQLHVQQLYVQQLHIQLLRIDDPARDILCALGSGVTALH